MIPEGQGRAEAAGATLPAPPHTHPLVSSFVGPPVHCPSVRPSVYCLPAIVPPGTVWGQEGEKIDKALVSGTSPLGEGDQMESRALLVRVRLQGAWPEGREP